MTNFHSALEDTGFLIWVMLGIGTHGRRVICLTITFTSGLTREWLSRSDETCFQIIDLLRPFNFGSFPYFTYYFSSTSFPVSSVFSY